MCFPISWALRSNSELTDLFNYHLTKLKESGVLAKIVSNWLSSTTPDDLSHRIFVDDAVTLGLNHLVFPCLVAFFGCCSAGLLFLMEIAIKWARGKMGEKQKQQKVLKQNQKPATNFYGDSIVEKRISWNPNSHKRTVNYFYHK